MSRVDFSSLGANSAYGGTLASSWSAALVEPPQIRKIRSKAADMLVRLGEIAAPVSGIPTRAVKFFCLFEIQDDQALIGANIRTQLDRERLALVEDGNKVRHVIERESLRPMIRNPKEVESRLSISTSDALNWRLLNVTEGRDELAAKRLRHTLAYIEYGETTDFKPTGRRAGGAVASRAQASRRKNWYAVPSQPAPAGRIAWTKGRGQVHYVTELPEGAQVPDNFYVSRPPTQVHHPRILAAIANLSWTHLMTEQFGRRAGGDGILQTYIRELNMLPVLNPLRLSAADTDRLVTAFEQVASRRVLPVTQELQELDRQNLDRLGLQLMLTKEDVATELQDVQQALIALSEERTAKASDGKKVQKASKARKNFDPGPIALSVLGLHQPPRGLAAAVALNPPAGSLESIGISIPDHPPIQDIYTPYDLLDDSSVVLNGKTRIETPSHVHAKLVRAHLSLLPNFSGELSLPLTEDDALLMYEAWAKNFVEWQTAVRKRVSDMVGNHKRVARIPEVIKHIDEQGGLVSGTTEDHISQW